MKIIHQKTRTLKVRDNNRSADAIAPNFIYGCCGGCMRSYCYVGRHNNDKVYINENTDQILRKIGEWAETKPWPKEPNQIDATYYVVDIGCSTDVGLHKKYNWDAVFSFFDHHPKLKSTFATKYPTRVDFNHKKEKNRVRVSLMPQKYSSVLEPGTDLIEDRINSLLRLSEHFEVHINFSPIIYEADWKDEYRKLFKRITQEGLEFKSECIFLTYTDTQAKVNSADVNELCYVPDMQELKTSQYGGDVLRYRHQVKSIMIQKFKEMYAEHFDLSTIRYIF